MTLDKHLLDGIGKVTKSKTLATRDFEEKLTANGYYQIGKGKAQAGRIKVWFAHQEYRRVEAIYSEHGDIAVTAYHT